MIFFQNYNKSRIHSYRGAKEVIILLDETKIFDGEIARASGDIVGSIDSFGDVSIKNKIFPLIFREFDRIFFIADYFVHNGRSYIGINRGKRFKFREMCL